MAIQFWENRKEKVLNQKLFSETAEAEARKVHAKANNTINKPTQLRKFYDEIISFDARYKQVLSKTPSESEKVFKQQLPFIHMLVPKVKYAEARKLVSTEFVDLIKSAVLDNLQEPDDLKILTSFFEAFIGHYKYCVEVEGRINRENNYRAGGKRNGY